MEQETMSPAATIERDSRERWRVLDGWLKARNARALWTTTVHNGRHRVRVSAWGIRGTLVLVTEHLGGPASTVPERAYGWDIYLPACGSTSTVKTLAQATSRLAEIEQEGRA